MLPELQIDPKPLPGRSTLLICIFFATSLHYLPLKFIISHFGIPDHYVGEEENP